MKPVAIFRHLPWEGAGYFGEFLARHDIPSQLIQVDQGEPIPDDPHPFSGLVFMGGNMSVNDPLPWIAQSVALIQQAVAAGIPVLGHCLGGQLISRAMGATVSDNPVKEIGWGEAYALDNATAYDWLNGIQQFTAFHWHGETFSLPPDAVHLFRSEACAHQAYVLHNKHLAMQCHVEMTEGMIIDWCKEGENEIKSARSSPHVQTAATMQTGMSTRIAALHHVADQLYRRWLTGLQRT
ncbi:MAG: type 1 glutamine amidotransferase [Betaproteobacteria bacterium]|nr:type 1 glutamine amidotransferase [Betaproteobacteria bacterium]